MDCSTRKGTAFPGVHCARRQGSAELTLDRAQFSPVTQKETSTQVSTRTCPTHNTTRRVSLNSQVREEGPVWLFWRPKWDVVGPGNSGFPQHKNPHSSNRAGSEPRSSDIGAQFWRAWPGRFRCPCWRATSLLRMS